MRTAKTLIRLVHVSFCWFCRAAAHLHSDFNPVAVSSSPDPVTYFIHTGHEIISNGHCLLTIDSSRAPDRYWRKYVPLVLVNSFTFEPE